MDYVAITLSVTSFLALTQLKYSCNCCHNKSWLLLNRHKRTHTLTNSGVPIDFFFFYVACHDGIARLTLGYWQYGIYYLSVSNSHKTSINGVRFWFLQWLFCIKCDGFLNRVLHKQAQHSKHNFCWNFLVQIYFISLFWYPQWFVSVLKLSFWINFCSTSWFLKHYNPIHKYILEGSLCFNNRTVQE